MTGTRSSGTNGTVIISGPDVLQVSDFYIRAGIINGNSLVRGLFALATHAGIPIHHLQRFHQRLAWVFQSPLLVIVFRGEMLMDVMQLGMLEHRISLIDVNAVLRMRGVLNVCQVECGIIEPTGNFTIFSIFSKREVSEARVRPDVLLAVLAYRKLCEEKGELGEQMSRERNEIASDAA